MGKKRKQEVSSEDSDDYRPKKKNKKNKIKKSAFDIDAKNIVATSGRRTRGVKIDYSLIEGSEDSDEPKKEDEGPKGKGKGPRKWDGTDDEFTLEESDKEKVEEEEEEEEEEDEDDEDEEARVQPKVVPAVHQQPARVHPSSKASPFPKAPPPDENEEDSDDGFQS